MCPGTRASVSLNIPVINTVIKILLGPEPAPPVEIYTGNYSLSLKVFAHTGHRYHDLLRGSQCSIP